jgi:hypothetical protein
MMMMVAVMAEALHLFPKYGKHGDCVKNFSSRGQVSGVRLQG